MKKTIMTLMLLAMIVSLSSCGGGGGAAGGNPPGNPSLAERLVITATAETFSLPANTLGWPPFDGSPFQTQVNIRVTYGNGQGVATGTIVHLQSQNTSVGFIGIPDDPSTTENEYAQGYVGVNQETIGSVATFYLRTEANAGSVTYVVNATHPGNSRNFETSFVLTVTQGPDPTVQQLAVSMPRTTLPVNSQNLDYFNGSPYVLEGDIVSRDIFGNVTSPLADPNNTDFGPFVNVSINPSSSLYFTVRDNPATENDERVTPRLNQGSIHMNSGHGIIYFQSKDVPGMSTVTVHGNDAATGRSIDSEFQIEVVDDGSNPNIPTDISLLSNSALYTNGSGGATSQAINVTVMAGSLPVADPQTNNVRLSISSDAPNSGEKLVGTNGNGATVQGETINIATTNGIANASIHSGTDTAQITLTVTADRADNNVDNGIQDGLSTVYHYVVSDGVLWALQLTNSSIGVIFVDGTRDNDGNIIEQNGFYDFTISAIGTDKGGNPALPQTLEFGMINSPLTGYPENGSGVFSISGVDGDPQEGGNNFTAINGSFITAGGGVQPNDTLVVFGEELAGNEDLESALKVASVQSETSLTTVENFNRNDETGTINNDLGIFPYVIGRAVDGNIENTATMDAEGKVTVKLHYPVSRIGQLATIFVKGQGRIVNGTPKIVTDAEMMVFPAVSGAKLIISPAYIPGNIDGIGFRACLYDGQNNPVPGRSVGFIYVGPGRGTIDGQLNSGVMNQYTGFDGCAYGVAGTSGVDSIDINEAGFIFNSSGIQCRPVLFDPATGAYNGPADQAPLCMIVDQGVALLTASPSAFFRSGTAEITLTLYDGNGNLIEGVPLTGSCQSDGGIISISDGPGVTDENGQTTVTVYFSLDGFGTSYSGTCTFSTADGDPSTVVTFEGLDVCEIATSPPAQCL